MKYKSLCLMVFAAMLLGSQAEAVKLIGMTFQSQELKFSSATQAVGKM
ncbi:MAG: hypothetical protein IJS28_00690 [Synergistaceae bacterium]|nr:hypothetical protein [Synergistaceae bacterium]